MSVADVDVVIAGAGPAGLAARLMLACHLPELSTTVVDPAGGWMTAWDHQFAAQAIPHLRSPSVHHPHPDPFALLRETPEPDLVRQAGTALPRTEAFEHFCRRTIAEHQLDGEVLPARVRTLAPTEAGCTVQVSGDDGDREIVARHVVVATNRRVPREPDWVERSPRVRHAGDVDLRTVRSEARIAIVGGGMSAGHLAVGACRAGNHVTLLTRGRLRVRRYDTHPTWLGPRKLQPFQSEPDLAVRRRQIDLARGGGSLPHWLARRVRTHHADGELEHVERTSVVSLDEDAHGLVLTLEDGRRIEVDELWLATGATVDVDTDPMLDLLRAHHPTAVHRGMPDLTEELRWPGTCVHLVGAAASLRIGPMAGNLIGHRRAAARVLAGLRGDDPRTAERRVHRCVTTARP